MLYKFISLIQQVINKLRTTIVSSRFCSWGGGVICRGFKSNGPAQICCANDIHLNEHIWISFNNNSGKLIIEDGVYIGRFCTMSISTEIKIKKNALISDRVFIGDCNHGFLDTSKPISQQPINFAGRVEIGEGSWIGIGVAILPGVKVGKNAVIGANSVVTHDVPDCCIAAGNPARIINRIKPDLEIK